MNVAPLARSSVKAYWLRGAWQACAFFGAYVIFAVVGAAVSLACLVPAALLRGVRMNRFGRQLIYRLFAFFVGYLRCCKLLQLDAAELDSLRNSCGLILVANHPCLLDAVLIISQLPQVVCLMKGGLARNLVLCGTARLAGYVRNESGPALIRQCESRLEQGANLLIFPEGTRTVGGQLQPFKMGFALIATRTRSPVQTILLTADSDCLGKGQPFFKKPSFPVRFAVRLGKRFEPAPTEDPKGFGSVIEAYFHSALSPDGKTVGVSRP